MISKKTIEVIKLTAPVLKIKGEEITKVFYKILFEKHPELKDVFNMVNQKKGKQQQALANAVFKYAIHIDELEGDATPSSIYRHAHHQFRTRIWNSTFACHMER